MIRRPPLALLAAASLAAALAGCGGSSGSTPTVRTPTASPQVQAAVHRAAAARHRAEARAPRGASPTLRALYATFPAPRPARGEPRAAKAVAAGEEACGGRSPLEVKEHFYPAAQAHLLAEQKRMISRLASFEAVQAHDPSFTAGQLAADVYAATLPESLSSSGYEGCVHALAKRLERRLAPKGGAKGRG